MNTCEAMEGRLNDHLDGLLRTEERLEVERHLESCSGCRDARDELLDLREKAAGLPRSIEPSRDLWPEIRARIPSTEGPLRFVRGGSPITVRWRPLLAAAAVVAVMGAVALLLPDAGSPEESALPVALGSFGAAETEYGRATEELLQALEERRGALSPETLAVVDENLRIIDQAIRDVRAALERDPADAGTGHRFTSLYARKVALLQQAVRLPSEGFEGGTS